MPFDNLLLDRDGPVGTITVNRPQVRNALDTATIDELRRAVLELKHDDRVRAVMLTGAGEKAFVAGADITQLSRSRPGGGEGLRAGRTARLRPDREPGQAGDRRGQRLRARRRLRAGDGLHVPDGGRHGAARAARGQARAHPRLRRHAAPAATGRQGTGAGPVPDRAARSTPRRRLRIGLVHRVVPAAELLARPGRWPASWRSWRPSPCGPRWTR